MGAAHCLKLLIHRIIFNSFSINSGFQCGDLLLAGGFFPLQPDRWFTILGQRFYIEGNVLQIPLPAVQLFTQLFDLKGNVVSL